MGKKFGLSKSRVMAGLQCEKRLWLEIHKRELLQVSAMAEAAFAQGHALGELARDLLGEGPLILHVDNIGRAIEETTAAVKTEPLLYEPAFNHDGVVARADALRKMRGGWHLIEVKASTSVKDNYLQDCALQSWVLSSAGAPVKKVTLAHINRDFVYQGDHNYDGLLHLEDITDAVAELQPYAPKWVAHLREILAGDEPRTPTGEHCKKPYQCGFAAYCRAQEPAPPEHPVSLLPHAGKLPDRMAAQGIHDLRQVPEDDLKNDVHRRIWKAHIAGEPILEAGAAAELEFHGWPRYYLDFETVKFSVPRWSGTRPYQALPYQWSCHVQQRDGSMTHAEFLDTSGDAPMAGFAQALLQAVGTRGPIFVYNQSFEATRVAELAELFPALAKPLLALNERMVDLLPMTKKYYYHPDMQGSYSIKKVLPTIAPELDYGALDEVQDGGAAELAWMEITHPDTPPERRDALRQSLLQYCKLDTLAMVRLVRFLSDA